METYFTSMHIIDRDSKRVFNQILDEEDAQAYIVQTSTEVAGDDHKKRYREASETTEVVAMVKKIFENKRPESGDVDVIAARFLSQETTAQTKIDHLGKKIRKGSLIQSFFLDDDGKYFFLISKIESNSFLDEVELTKRAGLPYDKKALKSCLFVLNEDGEITDIYISDTNRDGTEYWHNGFLELVELTSDEANTKKVFKILTEAIGKEFKKFPSEHTLYRNQMLGYFKTREDFRLDDAIEYIFGTALSDNPDVNIQLIKTKIRTKITTLKVDTDFSIKRNMINQRMWRVTRKLNDFSEISLNGHETEIKNSIHSEERNGEKYIIIKTTNDETFKSFLWNE